MTATNSAKWWWPYWAKNPCDSNLPTKNRNYRPLPSRGYSIKKDKTFWHPSAASNSIPSIGDLCNFVGIVPKYIGSGSNCGFSELCKTNLLFNTWLQNNALCPIHNSCSIVHTDSPHPKGVSDIIGARSPFRKQKEPMINYSAITINTAVIILRYRCTIVCINPVRTSPLPMLSLNIMTSTDEGASFNKTKVFTPM